MEEQQPDAAFETEHLPRNNSDSEREERVTRDKLKKASIANINENARTSSEDAREHPLSHSITADSSNSDEYQPRLRKKRSFEDLQDDTQNAAENGDIDTSKQKSGHHKRMRSRDVGNDEYVPVNRFDNDVPTPLREEDDAEAQESPGGPGLLIETPPRTSISPAPEATYSEKMDQVTSPRKKRSREQVDKEDIHAVSSTDARTGGPPVEDVATSETSSKLASTISRNVHGEPEKKRHRDESAASTEAREPLASTSILQPSPGFARMSSTSPFGDSNPSQTSVSASAESEVRTTSGSAFASSGLSAFASSAKSPFGSAGSTTNTTGGFGGQSKASTFASPPTSSTEKIGLGNAGAASPFATSRPSGFGTFGAGFGSGGSGFGGGPRSLGSSLSTFASSGPTRGTFGIGGTRSKAFGEPENEEEEGSENVHTDDEAENDEEEGVSREKPNSKRPIELNTGEEGEETIFSCRAKLYYFEGKEWKERGIGTLKLNETVVPRDDSPSPPPPDFSGDEPEEGERSQYTLKERKARLIMRTDGVHRLILNTPIVKGMKFGSADGKEPQGKTMIISGFDEGKPATFNVKIGKEEVIKELWRKLVDVQEQGQHPS